MLTNEEPSEETVGYLDKHFDTEGMVIQPKSAPDGSVMRYDFTLPRYQEPFKDSRIMLKASMFNSFVNGTRSFILIISYVYEICTNGLGHNLWDIHISKRHSSKKELVLGTDAKQLNNLHDVTRYMDKWSKTLTDIDIDLETNRLCFQPTHRDKSHVNQHSKKYILDQYDSYSKDMVKIYLVHIRHGHTGQHITQVHLSIQYMMVTKLLI